MSLLAIFFFAAAAMCLLAAFGERKDIGRCFSFLLYGGIAFVIGYYFYQP